MSSGSGKFDELAARIKGAITDAEGNVDTDGLKNRIRQEVEKASSDVHRDAIMAGLKSVAGQAEEKVDADKLRQWIGDVDRDKLRRWLDDVKAASAGAAALTEAQGEKLAARAPIAFDALADAAKDKMGSLADGDGLIAQGNIERIKGQIKETLAKVTDQAESEAADTVHRRKPEPDRGSDHS